ncbi:MAG: hypothetical protein AAB071_00705 [Bacteroidota bacterium]
MQTKKQPVKKEAPAPQSNKGKLWKPSEIKFLKKHYSKQGVAWCAKRLNRSIVSVSAIKVKLKLYRETFKLWSEFETRYLKKNFGHKTARSIARTLKRSKDAVQLKAQKLGLSEKARPRYTAEERQLIRDLYESGKATTRQIAQRFGKPVTSIRTRISRWGLKSPMIWSESEHDFLINNYPAMTAKEIAKKLGRTESAVIHKISRKGLSQRKSANE